MQIRRNEFSPIRHSRTTLIAQLGQPQPAKLGVIARTSIVRYKNTKENIAQIGTELTGAKLWLSGDLGGDFSTGQMDWVVVTFDKSVTPEQRQGLGEILHMCFRLNGNRSKLPNAFEYKGTNGFMLTFDMSSKDLANATTARY